MHQYKYRENIAERRRVWIHLVLLSDGITPATGESGPVQLTINGGAPVDSKNNIVEVSADDSPGLYYVELDTTELSTYGFMSVRFKSVTTAEFQNIIQVVGFDPYAADGSLAGINTQQPIIDYGLIAQAVKNSIPEFPTFPEIPAAPDPVNLDPVMAAIGALNEAVRNIDIPEQEKVDLGPVLEAIRSVGDEMKIVVEQKEVTPATDLTPVIESIQVDYAGMIKRAIDGILGQLREFFDGDIAALNEKIDGVMEEVGSMEFTIKPRKGKNGKPDTMEIKASDPEAADFVGLGEDQGEEDPNVILDRYLNTPSPAASSSMVDNAPIIVDNPGDMGDNLPTDPIINEQNNANQEEVAAI